MKEKLTHNLGMKILSLAIALVSWILIINIEDPVITRTFPGISVDIIHEEAINSLNQVYEVVEGDVVNISVKGKKSIIDSLNSADLKAEADLNKLSSVNAVPIRAYINKQIDSEIELSLGKVDTLRVSLEDVAEKQFQVTVDQVGQVQDGYSIGTIRVKPNLIKVIGAKSQISRIEEVRVQLDVSNASEAINTNLEPKVYDRNGYLIDSSNMKFSSDTIKVTAELLDTKTIPLLIDTTGEPADGYKYAGIDYEPKKVTIAGKQSDLDDMKYLAIKLDITNANENIEEEVNLADYLTDKIKIADDKQTAMVNITIEKLMTKRISFSVEDLEVKNIPSNLAFSFKNLGSLAIDVKGVEADLANLTIQDFKPYIDLKDLKKGTFTVQVHFSSLDNVEIQSREMVRIQLIEEETDEVKSTDKPADDRNDTDESTKDSPTPSPAAQSPENNIDKDNDNTDDSNVNQSDSKTDEENTADDKADASTIP
jgi:YbbR domain-containing protein